MGLFDYFRNRRDRESAMTAAQQEVGDAMQRAQQGQTQAQDLGGNGLQGLGALVSQLQAAQQAGLDVSGSSQVIDMRGSGLREEILGVIAAHGIDPSKDGQEIDASDAPALQADIMAVLANAGLDLRGAGIPMSIESAQPAEPEPPMDPNVPQIRNPLDR